MTRRGNLRRAFVVFGADTGIRSSFEQPVDFAKKKAGSEREMIIEELSKLTVA